MSNARVSAGRSVEPVTQDGVRATPTEEQAPAAATPGIELRQDCETAGKIRLRVTHGHLAFARHAVVVGHYIGDSLNGSELVLDRRHGGRLSRRRALGLHPGPLGSFDVYLDDRAQPKGSVVIGLGHISELTAGGLQQTVRRGLLALGAATDERDDQQGRADMRPRGVTCLLVGSGEGVLALPDCIRAILRALLQANRLLDPRGFSELEFVELIEQRAINTWHALHRQLEHAEFKETFSLDGDVERTKGARRRVGPEEDPSWWMPVTITAQSERDTGSAEPSQEAADRGSLRFVVIAVAPEPRLLWSLPSGRS